MKFPEKLTNKTWKNDKKLNFGPDFGLFRLKFGPILSPLDVIHCCKLSLFAILRKTNEPNVRKWQKIYFRVYFLTHLAQIRTLQKNFSKILLSVIRHHGQLLSYTISEKTNDPILRKLSDGRSNRETDRRTIVVS